MPSQTTSEQNSSAGVTPSAPWRLTAVSVLPGFRLAVTFRDGSSGIVDCSALSTSKNLGVYAELAESAIFDQVRLELGVVTWPNGADIDPAWMHEMLRDKKTWSVPFIR